MWNTLTNYREFVKCETQWLFTENLLRGSTTTDQDSRLSDNIDRHRDSKIHFDVPNDKDDDDTESEGVNILLPWLYNIL